jgi:hypothetical protein
VKLSFFHIAIILLLTACNKRPVEKPVWVNTTDTVHLPGAQLEFKTEVKEWAATLLTATQPIQLFSKFSNGKLQVAMLHKSGITEGPAEVCLFLDKQYFYYPVHILNESLIAVINKEFRSPKTVNPDSGLHQQRIVHSYDVYRNILPAQSNHDYFFEEEIALAPKAGVYRGVKNEALSSYYVQPGSCTSIPVKAVYKKEISGFYVTAGPLKDNANNIVADGTLVAFIYSGETQSFRMEASLLNGFANVIIPAVSTKQYTLKAMVNETSSNQIKLIP